LISCDAGPRLEADPGPRRTPHAPRSPPLLERLQSTSRPCCTLVDGRPLFDILLEETDPRYVKFEIDLG
jgi:hypothetical protein